MGEIIVKWSSMDRGVEQLNDCRKQLDLIRMEITATRISTWLISPQSAALQEKLKDAQKNLEKNADAMKNMVSVLRESKERYREAENKLADIVVESSGWLDDLKELLFSAFGSLGVPGKAAEVICRWGDVALGNNDTASIMKSLKKTATMGGDIWVDWLKVYKDSDRKTWKEVLGKNFKPYSSLPNGLDKTATKWSRFKGSVKDDLLEYFPGSNAEPSSIAKAKVKWAGTALSFISNAFSNTEEYESGEISGGRAVAETFMETGVDAALDIGVTAALTALLPAAAPAVAISATAVIVMWGADWLTKKVTKKFGGKEKGLTEVISDGILDGANWLKDKIGKAFSAKSTRPRWLSALS